MNKYDKFFIAIVLVCSIALYGSFEWIASLSVAGEKIAIVYFKDKEVIRIDMKQNKKYQVNGTLGVVDIEVLHGKIRVEKETSPYHVCSIQGWVNNTLTPIVCLPNHIVIVLKNDDVVLDDDVVVH